MTPFRRKFTITIHYPGDAKPVSYIRYGTFAHTVTANVTLRPEWYGISLSPIDAITWVGTAHHKDHKEPARVYVVEDFQEFPEIKQGVKS